MYRFSDVFVRPALLPLNWNYQLNWSFRPYKVPVASGNVVAQKSKTKQIVLADDPKDDPEDDTDDIEEDSKAVDE